MTKVTSIIVVSVLLLGGCATIPMASSENDTAQKQFSSPPEGASGLYIYRNSLLYGAFKKTIYLDGELIGETGPMVYYYKQVQPGIHKISSQSEFSNNDVMLKTESGKNYFIRQYVKMGAGFAFSGVAILQLVPEEEGKQGVLDCKLAK